MKNRKQRLDFLPVHFHVFYINTAFTPGDPIRAFRSTYILLLILPLIKNVSTQHHHQPHCLDFHFIWLLYYLSQLRDLPWWQCNDGLFHVFISRISETRQRQWNRAWLMMMTWHSHTTRTPTGNNTNTAHK